MAKRNLTVSLEVEGAAELMAAFSRLPAAVKERVREAGEMIAASEVPRLQAAARADSEQLALIAPSITTRSADFPSIVAGGTGKVPGHDATYGDILFGAEFGGGKSRATRQFRKHKGTEGYALFPQLREDQDEMVDAYMVAIRQAQEDVGLDGKDT